MERAKQLFIGKHVRIFCDEVINLYYYVLVKKNILLYFSNKNVQLKSQKGKWHSSGLFLCTQELYFYFLYTYLTPSLVCCFHVIIGSTCAHRTTNIYFKENYFLGSFTIYKKKVTTFMVYLLRNRLFYDSIFVKVFKKLQ